MARLLPAPGARILDVGCGRGELAAELAQAGHVVTGIDLDAEAVAAARARGVDAQEADFLAYAGGPFDLLLFSFSLHHIQPLQPALARAPTLLAPEGLVICEELAFENVDRATAAWFFATQELLLAAGLLPDGEPSPETAALEPVARWEAEFGHGHGGHDAPHDAQGDPAAHHHGHRHGDGHEDGHGEEPLHDAAEMKAQLAAHFNVTHEEAGAGLYAFWLDKLAPERPELALQLLKLERTLIAEGAIRPVGIRWVAARR